MINNSIILYYWTIYLYDLYKRKKSSSGRSNFYCQIIPLGITKNSPLHKQVLNIYKVISFIILWFFLKNIMSIVDKTIKVDPLIKPKKTINNIRFKLNTTKNCNLKINNIHDSIYFLNQKINEKYRFRKIICSGSIIFFEDLNYTSVNIEKSVNYVSLKFGFCEDSPYNMTQYPLVNSICWMKRNDKIRGLPSFNVRDLVIVRLWQDNSYFYNDNFRIMLFFLNDQWLDYIHCSIEKRLSKWCILEGLEILISSSLANNNSSNNKIPYTVLYSDILKKYKLKKTLFTTNMDEYYNTVIILKQTKVWKEKINMSLKSYHYDYNYNPLFEDNNIETLNIYF